MQLIRWNPIRDIYGLRNRINHKFDNSFYMAHWGDEKLSVWSWKPEKQKPNQITVH